jgi:hypothetical protein
VPWSRIAHRSISASPGYRSAIGRCSSHLVHTLPRRTCLCRDNAIGLAARRTTTVLAVDSQVLDDEVDVLRVAKGKAGVGAGGTCWVKLAGSQKVG